MFSQITGCLFEQSGDTCISKRAYHPLLHRFEHGSSWLICKNVAGKMFRIKLHCCIKVTLPGRFGFTGKAIYQINADVFKSGIPCPMKCFHGDICRVNSL